MTMDVPSISEVAVNNQENLDDLIPYYIVRKVPENHNSSNQENISVREYIENVSASLELNSTDINGITEIDNDHNVNDLERTEHEELNDMEHSPEESYTDDNNIIEELELDYNKQNVVQLNYSDKDNGELVLISYEDAPRERFKIMTSGLVKCLRCEVFFKTEILFQVHQCSIGFRCTSCYNEFSKYSDLVRHELTHINSDQLQGTKSKEMPYSTSMENDEVVKKCHLCGNAYSKSEELEEHLKWHQLVKCYLCDFCGQEFKEHFKMVLHVAKCPKRYSASSKEQKEKIASVRTPKTDKKSENDLKTRILNGEFKVSVSLTRLTEEQIAGKLKNGFPRFTRRGRRRLKGIKLEKSDRVELPLKQKVIPKPSKPNKILSNFSNEIKKMIVTDMPKEPENQPKKCANDHHKNPVHVISDIQLCPPNTELQKLPIESESSKRSEANDFKVYDDYPISEEQINNEKSFIHSIYICKLCKVRFARRELSHLHVCFSTEEKCRTCAICNIAYSTPQVLDEHMSIHEITNYMCFHCNTCCGTFENLLIHVRQCAQAPTDTADHLSNGCDELYECEDGLICRSCKAHFKTRIDYNKHFCVTCNVCSAVFNSLNSFMMHMKKYDISSESIPKENAENLQVTNISMNTIEEYYVEVQNEDMDESSILYKNTSEPYYIEYEEENRSAVDTDVKVYYDCTNCHKQFNKIHSLERHNELYRRKVIRCTECKLVFTLRSDCYNHIKKLHKKSSITKEMVQEEFEPTCDKSKYNNNDKNSVWVCDLCGMSSQDKKEISGHVTSHDTLMYKCPYCEGELFASGNLFTSHIRKYHQDISSVLLDQLTNEILDSFISCRPKNPQSDDDLLVQPKESASTEDEEIINDEMVSDAVDNEDKLNCPQCNKNFLTKKLFVKHMLKHIKVKEFKCNICQDVFNLKVFLKKHTKRHRKHFPHVCPSCCHVFKTKNKLQSHFKQHLDTLTLTNNCSLCDCDFDTHKQLVHHQVVVHRMRKMAK